MEKLHFIFETSQSLSDTGIGTIAGDWENKSDDIHRARVNWCAKKAVPDEPPVLSEDVFGGLHII